MNCQIRKARVSDVKIINNFLTRLIHDEKKYNNNINENCVVNKFYENIIENPQNCILIAETNNKIIGYLYGFIQNNGNTYINIVTQIDAIFVDENYRKMGIGTMLIKEFKKWSECKNAKHIEITACNDNNIAILLYKEMGFKNFKTVMSLDL